MEGWHLFQMTGWLDSKGDCHDFLRNLAMTGNGKLTGDTATSAV